MTAAVRPITRRETRAIVADLAKAGIEIRAVRCGQTIHIQPVGRVTTEQEVRALAPFIARSVYRLAWHGAVTR